MDTLDFFKRVLPTEGNYCAIVINDGPPQQSFFGTVEELATRCQQLDANGNNTYYATSTFKTNLNRTQDNVELNKVLFLDIDCGAAKAAEEKGYATQALGLEALAQFITVTKMPSPMVVNSGTGLHVYWILDEALPKDEWQLLADALKATFQVNGFFFDAAVTADAARVLRPAGTHNPKNGAEVRVLAEGSEHSKQTLQNILGSAKPTLVTDMGTVVPTIVAPQSGLSQALEMENLYQPSNAGTIYNGCEQVAWAVDNQDKASEPTWYALMGIAAYCEDSDNVAKLWSSKHPDYDEHKTLAKMAQWKAQATGPATCARFKEERKKGCDNCPLKGSISTPARLGTQHVEIVRDPNTLPEGVDPEVKLPPIFKEAAHGIVQSVDGTEIDVCPFILYPIGYGRDEHLGYETVRYKWKRPHVGWQDLTFRQAYLNDESREFATTIADQGIVLTGKKQTDRFRFMLRTYMDELRKKRSMSNIHDAMGWKEDHTQFVIGERLYKREVDGTVTTEVVTLGAAAGDTSKTAYTHAGSATEWAEATGVLEKAGMPWHMFALNTSFSAPLWDLTGLVGLTISLHGDTGAGKSVIQAWSRSVWGNPKSLYLSAESTHNALYNKLGTYCNLPMTIDECTYMDNVGSFCYQVTQGKDKGRLTRFATERKSKQWATNVMVSTNISFTSKMAASGVESDAQMARLLEIYTPVHPMFAKGTKAGRTIMDFLGDNHGVIGHLYAIELLKIGKDGLVKRIKKAIEQFREIYGIEFAGTERYWETELVLQHVGCTIAAEAGLIAYDFGKGIKYVVKRIERMRTAIEDSHLDGFDLVHQYLNETAANGITIMHTQNVTPTFDPTRLPKAAILIRYDVHRTGNLDKFDRGTVMIVQGEFRKWLAGHGYDWGKLKKEIAAVNGNATPGGGRFVMSKDTALKAGQQYVIGINLNIPQMKGFLDAAQDTADEMTLGQLGVVPS